MLIALSEFFCISANAASRSKIELPSPLKQEVEVLLNEGILLHKSLVDENSRSSVKAMRRILAQKKKVDKRLAQAKSDRPHLEKILNAVQLNMENALSEEAKNRDSYFTATFEQFVQIVKIFKVTEYAVFFCSKNKTVWYQEDRKKPKNPVNHKTYAGCGQLVRI
jgi:hypothetical protein